VKRHPLAIALALLCALAATAAGGATLYVSRTVVADPGALRVRDLVRVPGDLPPGANTAFDSAVATLAGVPLSVPARLYAGLIEEAFGPDSIMVGSRTLVVPRGQVDEQGAQLLARLADFLDQQGVLGGDRVELQLLQPLPVLAQGADPAFRILRSTQGPAGTEVTCAVSAGKGGAAPASVSLRVRTSAASAAAGVRAGDPVQVRFRRGPVTIEMQGKALATAGFGDSVAVYIPDSLKRFSGRVVGTKAVDVELP
jgi:hypothetical protein